jgi:hypothetical protein
VLDIHDFKAFNLADETVMLTLLRPYVRLINVAGSRAIISVKENGYAIIEHIQVNSADDWYDLVLLFFQTFKEIPYKGMIVPTSNTEQKKWLQKHGLNKEVVFNVYSFNVAEIAVNYNLSKTVKPVTKDLFSEISKMYSLFTKPFRHVIEEMNHWIQIIPNGFLSVRDELGRCKGVIFCHEALPCVAWIRGLIVNQQYGRKGVGRALVTAAHIYALKRNIAKITVATEIPTFWEKIGYKKIKDIKLLYCEKTLN